MSEENIKITRGIYEHFNRKDYEGVMEVFAEDFEWRAADSSPLADQSPYLGLKEVRERVFERIKAGFETLKVNADEIFGAGDKVVVLGYYEGVYRPNGKSFEAQVAHVWTFNDGKAVKFQQYADTLRIALITRSENQ